jgi:hypothetical protein
VASTRDWFESVAEARRRARRRLPRPVFMALEAGAEAGVTRADNVAAFGEIRLRRPGWPICRPRAICARRCSGWTSACR